MYLLFLFCGIQHASGDLKTCKRLSGNKHFLKELSLFIQNYYFISKEKKSCRNVNKSLNISLTLELKTGQW